MQRQSLKRVLVSLKVCMKFCVVTLTNLWRGLKETKSEDGEIDKKTVAIFEERKDGVTKGLSIEDREEMNLKGMRSQNQQDSANQK